MTGHYQRVVAESAHAGLDQFAIPAFVVAAAEDNWVDRFSAGLNVPRERIWNVRGSHTSAVKPHTRTDDEYLWVKDRIRALAESARSNVAHSDAPRRSIDDALKKDLADALALGFAYGDLEKRLSAHLGRIDGIVDVHAAPNSFAALVEWAAREWRWTRALVRVMVEERPGVPGVAAFVLKYPQFCPALAADEREQVRQCFADAVTDYASLRNLVTATLGVNLNTLLDGPGRSAAAVHLPFVIRFADHVDGMEAFIEEALVRFPGPVMRGKVGPLLDAIRQRRSAPRAEIDPFEAFDLGGKFLIDRRPLRNALRGVIDDKLKTRIVAVKGPAGSGKTHSIYFIEHIEQRLGKYDKAVVRVEQDEPPATMTPQHLAGSILDLIGGSRTPPEKTVDLTETRWIRRVADYVVGQIKSRPRPVFVVLDGFANENLPPLTRELVRELVKRAGSEPNLRIALLDYRDDLLSVEASGRSVTEPIAVITAADLTRFFTDFARAQGESPPPKESIDVVVQSVLEAVTPGDPRPNERIAQEVDAWVQRLKAGR